MKTTTRFAFAALIVAAAVLGACNNNKESATDTSKMEARATNTTCPFTGAKANAEVTSAHEGKTVAFCCAGCKGKFDKMDDAHQDAMVAKAK